MTAQRYFELSALWRAGSDDVAEISLRLGEQTLSRIADTEKHTVRDYFRASATTLGLWFVDNWWRLRWETLSDSRFASVDWRLRHELNSAAGGALWPPVMIYSAADRIVFAPSFGKSTVAGPQQYFESKVAMVMANEYEAELDGFLDVVARHCARSEDGKALETILRQIRAERADPELAGWRRLEACLGYDADQAPNAVIDALIELEEVAGEDGVEEAARAQPGLASATVLTESIEATRVSKVEVNLDLAAQIERDPTLPPSASPWRFAAGAASDLRRIIGVRHGPLSHQEFSGIFQARWADLRTATATARSLPYGARLGDDSGNARLSLQTLLSHDRRFELARTLGDAIWQGAESFGVVSRAKTDRQKFQRAFAHDLLCPFDDLSRILDVNAPTQDAIDSAARTFLVHSSVVRNQLVYKGYLPFENPGEEADAA